MLKKKSPYVINPFNEVEIHKVLQGVAVSRLFLCDGFAIGGFTFDPFIEKRVNYSCELKERLVRKKMVTNDLKFYFRGWEQ